jgi:hypothetical protein
VHLIKRGTVCLPSHGGPQQKKFPPCCRGLQPKQFHPFWVQFTDIHPTTILFVKGKLHVGFKFPPLEQPLSEPVKAFSHDNKPVIVSTSQLIFRKALFSSSSNVFCSQKWFNLPTNVLHLHRTPSLVTPSLDCWLVSWFFFKASLWSVFASILQLSSLTLSSPLRRAKEVTFNHRISKSAGKTRRQSTLYGSTGLQVKESAAVTMPHLKKV